MSEAAALETAALVEAKRVHESRIPCPACGAELAVAKHGWAFGPEAARGAQLEEIDCFACDAMWDASGARALVEAARRVPDPARRWSKEHVEAVARLRSLVASDAVVATPLGVFFTQTHAAYAGRNPRTGEIVPVPEKRRRDFVPDAALLARAIDGAAERPLRRDDLHGDDVGPRYDEEPRLAPPATPAIDLPGALEVLAAELRARGEAQLGRVGTLAIRGTHDDETLYTTVAMSFSTTLQPSHR